MSNGYGIDIYGTVTYGYSQPVDFSVAPFIAKQTDYNRISLQWASPNSTTFWKELLVVRSLYGYPSTPADGTVVLTVTPTTVRTNYDDTGLLPGRLYYYTIFIGKDYATWNNITTYNAGDIVTFGANLYWVSQSSSNTGNTPAAGSAFWRNVAYTPTWAPAGYASSLTVTDWSYGNILYNRIPQPYKVSTTEVFSTASTDNEPLHQYMNVMGWGLNTLRTQYESYRFLNDPDVVAASNLDVLGKQLGIKTDYLSSPQARRQRIKNLSVNYRLKGTDISIHNAVAAITGWDSVVTPSKNQMLGSDQAQFTHPLLDKWNASTVYQVGDKIQYQNYNYTCLVRALGVAQAPTGANSSNTWWQVNVSTPAAPILDSAQTLKNPKAYTTLDPSFSSWQMQWNATPGTGENILTGVYTGLPHHSDPTIHNWNWLGYRNTLGASWTHNPFAFSVNRVAIAAWSNATNYVVNNYVTYNSTSWIAIKPSGPGTTYGFITPGTNALFWNSVVLDLVGGDPYDPTNWTSDAIPMIQNRIWNPSTQYEAEDRVSYQGIIYQAINDNTNSTPSGYYYSNKNWIYIQPAEYTFTASAYQGRLTTTSSSNNFYYDIGYFFESDNVAGFPGITPQSTNSLLARFDGDYTDLNGVNDNTIANTTNPWVASPSTANLWYSSYGMAVVNIGIAGTTAYNFLRMDDTLARTNKNIWITFGTSFVDSGHRGHGIFFRWQDNNNFWHVTRRALYKVVAGVETAVVTWTPLNDGDRLTVGLDTSSSNQIKVDVYQRIIDGDVPLNWPTMRNLALIHDATFVSSTQCGLIVKYSASGAV